MEVEENRLTSFAGKWPESSPVSAKELAEAGFYYHGPFDRVRCHRCEGTVYQWVPGDSPIGEHKRLFPHCSFVQELLHSNSAAAAPPNLMDMHEAKALLLLGYSEIVVRRAFAQTGEASVATVDGLLNAIHASEDADAAKSGSAELRREIERLRGENICKVCFEQEVRVAFLPCTHYACCSLCANNLKECPMCRQRILGHLSIYRS